jgi:hypothetical protein
MQTVQTKKRDFDAMAWSLFFIWWGITELVKFPEGTGAVGIGLILLGSNVARSLNGLSTNGFTITLGLLALVWGGLELAGSLLSLPFELPVFAIVLIVLGVILLVRELQRNSNE